MGPRLECGLGSRLGSTPVECGLGPRCGLRLGPRLERGLGAAPPTICRLGSPLGLGSSLVRLPQDRDGPAYCESF